MKKDLVTTKQISTKSRLLNRYEELLRGIEENKNKRRDLDEGLRLIVLRIRSKIRPMLNERDLLIRKRLFRLDELAGEFGTDKHTRKYFEAYMVEQTAEMLDRIGFGDTELRQLFEKYAGDSLVSNAKAMAPIAQQFRDAFGVDIDLQEIVDKGVDQFLSEHSGELRKRQEMQDAQDLERFDPAAKQKVSTHQKALLQDSRSIYMSLVKKYHPDRETDEAAKIQKTEFIQRITKAYRENDFLTLLKLQIEYLEEGETDAKMLADDMLKRYNKILQKQLDEIKQEIDHLKVTNKELFEDFFGFDGKFNERKFKKIKKMLREELERTQTDLNYSKTHSEAWFNQWIKAIKT